MARLRRVQAHPSRARESGALVRLCRPRRVLHMKDRFMNTITPNDQIVTGTDLLPLEASSAMTAVPDIAACFASWKEKGAVSLVSSNPFKNKILYDYVSTYQMEAMPVGAMIFDRCYSRFIDMEWGLVIICLDDFNGVGPIFNKLRYLRNHFPEIPIILTSFGFKSHDLSEERLQICDASIRFPIDIKSLDEIFLAAWRNNAAWRVRLAALQDC